MTYKMLRDKMNEYNRKIKSLLWTMHLIIFISAKLKIKFFMILFIKNINFCRIDQFIFFTKFNMYLGMSNKLNILVF